MFKRWIKLLFALAVLAGICASLQSFFVNRRYQDYSRTLKICGEMEDRLISVREWSPGEKSKWESMCDATNKYSDASVEYGFYRDLSDSQDKTVLALGGILFLVGVSFIAKWLISGRP